MHRPRDNSGVFVARRADRGIAGAPWGRGIRTNAMPSATARAVSHDLAAVANL